MKRAKVSCEERVCQKYELNLLSRKIRLRDVPKRLRRNPVYARDIYVTGFRADRMVSKARYKEDLLLLQTEILFVEAKGERPVLLEKPQNILEQMQDNLRLFDLYDISDFH